MRPVTWILTITGLAIACVNGIPWLIGVMAFLLGTGIGLWAAHHG